MSDYHELVKKEAKAFHDANKAVFASDSSEHGGKSKLPNLGKWMDHHGKLSARITELSAKWTSKDIHWVEHNTRNRNLQGGDPKSNAFASFLKDVRHEIKKLAKG